MEKKWKIVIGIVIAIVLLALVYIFLIKPGKKTEKTQAENKEMTELKAQLQKADKEYNTLYDSLNVVAAKAQRADSLQKALNKCQGVMTVEEENAALKKELADTKAKLAKKPVAKKTAVRKSPKADVTPVDFPTTFTATATKSVGPSDSYAVSSDQFAGVSKGDYLTTIDDAGYLTYKVSKKLSAQAPRLNGVSGPKFSDNGNYWTYTDNSRLISTAEINTATVIWTIYVGDKNYGTGSYPVFLPHELLKPLIVQARGYDYGAITSADIQRMAQTNPLVGKSLIPNSADGHSATDQNYWNGWAFKTKIVAVKK